MSAAWGVFFGLAVGLLAGWSISAARYRDALRYGIDLTLHSKGEADRWKRAAEELKRELDEALRGPR